MREGEIREYLRDTERRAYQVQNRLDDLHELQLRTLIQRRSHNSGVAWHATTTAAGVLLVRKEIKRQRTELEKLRGEAEAARDRLEEMEGQRQQEEAEKERQREEQRRAEARQRDELQAELEAAQERAEEEQQRAQEARQRAAEVERALELERARVSELTQDLEEQRQQGEQTANGREEPMPPIDPDFYARGLDGDEGRPYDGRDDPGDREGPDPMGAGVGLGPRGPEPGGGGGAADPPQRGRDEQRDAELENDYEREV